MNEPAIRTYRAFWPYYLHEHARARTRTWHIAGTIVAALFLLGAILLADPWLLIGVALAGYGPAWCAHFLVEKNCPATFRYPLWSLVCDVRMTATWLTGGLSRELEKAGITERAER
jgi:hypothetical protein